MRFKLLREAALGAFVICLLAACGGGRPEAQAERPAARLQAAAQAAASEMGSAVAVTRLTLQSSERTGRTSFKYTFEVHATNSAATVQAVSLQLSQVGAGTTIVQGRIDTGLLPAGATQAVGTVVVLQDRNVPFNAGTWVWSIAEQVSSVRPAVSSAVPAAVGSRITAFVSPVGRAPAGAALPINLQTRSGGSLVVAVNSEDQVLLASPVQGPSVELSAESSALALVLLLNGDPGRTQAEVIQRMKAVASFAPLVREVETALARATAYSTDPRVLLAASKVIGEMLAAPSANAAATVRRRALEVASVRASRSGLPFPLVQDLVLNQGNVAITGSCKDRGLLETSCGGDHAKDADAISVGNLAPIPFAVSVKDAAGNTVASDIEVRTDSLTLSRWIFRAQPIENPFSTAVITAIPTRGKGVSLTFSQPASMRIKTARTSLFELAGIVLDQLPTNNRSCADQAMKSFLDAIISTGSESGDPTFSGTLAAFFEAMRDPEQVATYFGACLGSGAPSFAELNRIGLDLLDKQRDVLSKAQLALEVSALTAKFLYLWYYWDYAPNTVGICLDSNGRLNNCNASLAFTPATVWAIPGARLDTAVRLTARDKNGAETIPSADLQYASLGTPVILDLDPLKGSAMAKAEGLTAVRLTDLATGVTGGYDVVVTKPQLMLSATSYAVGEYAVVRVVDTQGNLLLVPDNTQWDSSRTDVAILDVPASLLNCGANQGCRAFKVIGAGDTTVTFTAGNQSASARIATGVAECNPATWVAGQSWPLYNRATSKYGSYVVHSCPGIQKGGTYSIDRLFKFVPNADVPPFAHACIENSSNAVVHGTPVYFSGRPYYCFTAWGTPPPTPPCSSVSAWGIQPMSAISITPQASGGVSLSGRVFSLQVFFDTRTNRDSCWTDQDNWVAGFTVQ